MEAVLKNDYHITLRKIHAVKSCKKRQDRAFLFLEVGERRNGQLISLTMLFLVRMSVLRAEISTHNLVKTAEGLCTRLRLTVIV
jgi:hypothetical protein